MNKEYILVVSSPNPGRDLTAAEYSSFINFLQKRGGYQLLRQKDRGSSLVFRKMANYGLITYKVSLEDGKIKMRITSDLIGVWCNWPLYGLFYRYFFPKHIDKLCRLLNSNFYKVDLFEKTN